MGGTHCEADKRVKNDDRPKETKSNRRPKCKLNGIEIDVVTGDEHLAIFATKHQNGVLNHDKFEIVILILQRRCHECFIKFMTKWATTLKRSAECEVLDTSNTLIVGKFLRFR